MGWDGRSCSLLTAVAVLPPVRLSVDIIMNTEVWDMYVFFYGGLFLLSVTF